MSKKNLAIIIVLVIVVGIGAVVWMTRGSSSTTNSTTSGNSTSSSSQSSAATITYSDSGFSPSTVTVHSGDTITLKNTSSASMQFDSDPHPVHTGDPELNVGEISPGQSATLQVAAKGTHGYHNHLNPAQTGTIVVQ